MTVKKTSDAKGAKAKGGGRRKAPATKPVAEPKKKAAVSVEEKEAVPKGPALADLKAAAADLTDVLKLEGQYAITAKDAGGLSTSILAAAQELVPADGKVPGSDEVYEPDKVAQGTVDVLAALGFVGAEKLAVREAVAPPKVKKEKAEKKEKAPKAEKGPGVIETILDIIGTKGPITREALLVELASRFPARDSERMKKTVQAQLGGKKHPCRMERERGVIFKIAASDGAFSIEKK
jgi:hypothetical protein